ncbi:MAG: hypothetical protein J1F69_05810 [Clostridiales bacterium]|nr:hypothetical protein [Clostridiales bacterium]
MKLEDVFDIRDFTEPELERLRHEIIVIKRARCESAIIEAIEEIKNIPPEQEYYICGAANCSFLLYALGVTKVDPLRFDLPFERFINPLRKHSQPTVQAEFAPKKHIQTNLTAEELIASQIIREQTETCAIPLSTYRDQPLYDILYSTQGNLLWQEQFINILNRVGGMLPEHADRARTEVCKYGANSYNCDIFYDWMIDHSKRLGYNIVDMFDFSRQIFDDIRYAKCKAHYLSQAIHNYDFTLSHEKRTAVVCFGEAYNIAKHISPEKISAYRCYDTRLELNNAIATDKYLCCNSDCGMTKGDFLIRSEATSGLGAGNNESLGKSAAQSIERELKNDIQNLKEKGVLKIVIIAYSGTFECFATELAYNICKEEKMTCDIYAYHIGTRSFPDISPQEKRISDLEKNLGVEILFYPEIKEHDSSPSVLDDIDKQYAKTIEYTCI